MQALTYWKTVVMDQSDFLEKLIRCWRKPTFATPVAALADTLQGKIWAALDPDQRGSKRQKDLADIARLIEAYPHLRQQVPTELLDRLF